MSKPAESYRKTVQAVSAVREKRLAELVERNAELIRALQPFAELADICDHFRKPDDVAICSWRIAGERHRGPTAGDCRKARDAILFAKGGEQ
jgi:hypothetical protein